MSLHVLFFLDFNTENQSWLVITLMQKFLELICLLHVIACAVFFGRIKIWKWLVETDFMGIKSGNGLLKLILWGLKSGNGIVETDLFKS